MVDCLADPHSELCWVAPRPALRRSLQWKYNGEQLHSACVDCMTIPAGVAARTLYATSSRRVAGTNTAAGLPPQANTMRRDDQCSPVDEVFSTIPPLQEAASCVELARAPTPPLLSVAMVPQSSLVPARHSANAKRSSGVLAREGMRRQRQKMLGSGATLRCKRMAVSGSSRGAGTQSLSDWSARSAPAVEGLRPGDCGFAVHENVNGR